MRPITILFLILVGCHAVRAQKKVKIRYSDSTHLFVAYLDTARDNFNLSTLVIYQLPGYKKTQVIYPGKHWCQDFGEGSFLVEDMNFDGYDDLRITANTTANGQVSHICWFYNKKTGLFVRDTTYDGFSEISFDHKNKLIHTWWSCCIGYGYHALYKWENGKPVLIGEEEGDGILMREDMDPEHCSLNKK